MDRKPGMVDEEFEGSGAAAGRFRFPLWFPRPDLEESPIGARESHRRRLLALTGKDFPEVDARELLRGIERHREYLRDRLGRDPGKELAALDYLKNVVVAAPDLRVVADEALDRLRGLARSDALTGVLNRRGFEPVLQRERARAKRAGESLALLLVDVDSFKRVNDYHGHPTGDRVLARLAALLVKECRTSDVVARLGGDEFVVLLPATETAGAEKLAERIRRAVASANLIGNGEPVTVSIGISVDDGRGEHELIAAADAALYRAKREGRDRIAS